MRNPFQRFRYLPWLILLQSAALAIALMILLEFLLLAGSTSTPLVRQTIVILFSPPLGLLMALAIAMGFGAVGVYFLERRSVVLNTGVLWALVLCLMAMLLGSSILRLSALILPAGQVSLIGVVLGVFVKGRRYWRY